MKDIEIFNLINKEGKRQEDTIELIASENIVSNEVMFAQGSILTNKYAEGYPNKRYYGGTDVVDEIENIAIDRVKELFNCKFANVQPHSGSQANAAVYMALLNPGDTVLGMDLSSGGHLTHGSSVNFSGKLYNFVSYGVNKNTETLDYNEIEEIAIEAKPKLIVAGSSAYSRIIDFSKFKNIANKVGAYLMVDMAHIAGLVATGLHPNPIEYADVVTSTTHKTLRGPRGGIILSNNEDLIKKINSAIFPGTQGGPLMHVIASKAVSFKEALSEEFKIYTKNVIKNSKIMAEEFIKNPNFRVISNGTDNHLFLVDVTKVVPDGKTAQEILDSINITTNKNSIPFETLSPFKTSGIRIGSPAITSRGFSTEDSRKISKLIIQALENYNNKEILEKIKIEVKNLTEKYPLKY